MKSLLYLFIFFIIVVANAQSDQSSLNKYLSQKIKDNKKTMDIMQKRHDENSKEELRSAYGEYLDNVANELNILNIIKTENHPEVLKRAFVLFLIKRDILKNEYHLKSIKERNLKVPKYEISKIDREIAELHRIFDIIEKEDRK